MARLLRSDVVAGETLLHFLLQLLKAVHDAVHAFERIFALMLQTNVRGFSEDLDAQRNGAAVRVPDAPACRLGQQHTNAVAAQFSLCRQPRRAPFTTGFFIGYQRQRDSAIEFGGTFFQRKDREEHGHNSAFHVAGTAAKQEMLLPKWVKLLFELRRNNIVVPVKVQNPFSPSIVANQTDGTVGSSLCLLARFESLAFEALSPQSILEQIGAGAIIPPWRILRGYGHKLGQQRRHLVLMLLQPFHQVAEFCRGCSRSLGHMSSC